MSNSNIFFSRGSIFYVLIWKLKLEEIMGDSVPGGPCFWKENAVVTIN